VVDPATHGISASVEPVKAENSCQSNSAAKLSQCRMMHRASDERNPLATCRVAGVREGLVFWIPEDSISPTATF